MKKILMPSPDQALPGRSTKMRVSTKHFVSGNSTQPPFPESLQTAIFGLGCFWGAEQRFWQCPGIFSTAVGYTAGYTPNPTYDEVCTGLTGHNEVVQVIFDPTITAYETLLKLFWEAHNPTQGMQQGNDIGTQYRSGIYTRNQQQQKTAIESKERYQKLLHQSGLGDITTEIIPANEFYYAEDYHQQYLAKNPSGYCGLGGTSVIFE
jgi:peptide-methionine (S)-S-oxide reductase